MGGIHASFMPQEALDACDAVVIGKAELVLEKLLDDLEHGRMRGAYQADQPASDGRPADAAVRPGQEKPLREQHLRADLPGLLSRLYVLLPSRS